MKQKSLALPIRCVDFSNSSQVVSLFTREHGLVDGIAKGSYREKNPFHGPFDLAVLYEVIFIERPGAGLSILTEACVVDGFRGVRRTWERHVAVSHLIEFLRSVVVAAEPEPDLFDLAAGTFADIGAAEGRRLRAALLRFDAAALRTLGLLAPMDACVECGRERQGDTSAVFLSPRDHGILCRHCRAGRERVVGLKLSSAAVRLIDRLSRPWSPDFDWQDLDERWPQLERPLTRVLAQLRTNLLERELVLLQSSRRWL